MSRHGHTTGKPAEPPPLCLLRLPHCANGLSNSRNGSLIAGGSIARLIAIGLTLFGATRHTLAQPCPWTEVSLLARTQHSTAYDSGRGVTVLFGGGAPTYVPRNDTWEWDGDIWTRRSGAGPAPRNASAMTYDSIRGVTVLFGGRDTEQDFGDTWEWDGLRWTLRADNGPSPRSGHSMSYDSGRGVTVLFGGDAGAINNETWEWDGTQWTLRAETGTTAANECDMAYDSRRGVTVSALSTTSTTRDVFRRSRATRTRCTTT